MPLHTHATLQISTERVSNAHMQQTQTRHISHTRTRAALCFTHTLSSALKCVSHTCCCSLHTHIKRCPLLFLFFGAICKCVSVLSLPLPSFASLLLEQVSKNCSFFLPPPFLLSLQSRKHAPLYLSLSFLSAFLCPITFAVRTANADLSLTVFLTFSPTFPL